MLLADADTDILVNLDEEIEKLPPCESLTHTRGLNGHVPEAYAEYWIIPSCGHEWYACAGWTKRVARVFGFYICPDGGENHTATFRSIIPLK